MSFKTKLTALAVAVITVAAVTAADAKPKIDPVTGLLIGAAVVGTTAAIAASQPGYPVYPRRNCWLQPQQNMFGQVFYVRQCSYYNY